MVGIQEETKSIKTSPPTPYSHVDGEKDRSPVLHREPHSHQPSNRTGRQKLKDPSGCSRLKPVTLDVGKVLLKQTGRPSSTQKRELEVKLGLDEGLQGKILDSFKSRLEENPVSK
eukprot:Gb_29075 [translate_table: standard]